MSRCAIGIAFATLLALGQAAASAQPLEGAWTSIGYGMYFDIAGATITGYEITKVSCLKAFTATRKDESETPNESTYVITEQPVTFFIRPGNALEVRRVHFDGSASDIVIRRLESPPAACSSPLVDTPLNNFDVFARTWAEQYGFFDLKHADWQSIVLNQRSRITATTTPAELFDTLTSMIAPFNDAHSSIRAEKIEKSWNGWRRNANWLEPAARPRAFEVVDREYVRGPLRSWLNGQMQFGYLADSVAYLRIKEFSGYASDHRFASGLAALEAALDDVFAESSTWSGLIIDVRINGGGADPYGLAIASRLTTKDYVAYSKEARSNPDDPTQWTEAQPSLVRPSTRAGFKGSVVELIGIDSVSAAETFTQALMKREPKVIRVGENTQGAFSDVLRRKLPNGWRFGVSNERFVTDGRSFEGFGIPPDIDVPVFPESDLSGGRDGALEKALDIVRAARTSEAR